MHHAWKERVVALSGAGEKDNQALVQWQQSWQRMLRLRDTHTNRSRFWSSVWLRFLTMVIVMNFETTGGRRKDGSNVALCVRTSA